MKILRRAYFQRAGDTLRQVEPDAENQQGDMALVSMLPAGFARIAGAKHETDGPGYFVFNLPALREPTRQVLEDGRSLLPVDTPYNRLIDFREGYAGEGLTPLQSLEPFLRPWLEDQKPGESVVTLFFSDGLYRIYELALPL